MKPLYIFAGVVALFALARISTATAPTPMDSDLRAFGWTWNGEEYRTHFDWPQTGGTAGTCAWSAATSGISDQDWTEEAGPGIRAYETWPFDSYFGTGARGWKYYTYHGYGQMLVHGLAFDNVDLNSESISKSHMANTWIKLQKTDATACDHYKGVGLKPTFTIFAGVTNNASLSDDHIEITGRVIETSVNLGVVADLSGSVRGDDDGSSGSGAQVSVLGFSLPIPVPSTSSYTHQHTFTHALMSGSRRLDWEMVVMQTSDSVNAHANGWTEWPLQDDCEVRGWLFDSLAGVKLRAWCGSPSGAPPSVVPPPPSSPPTPITPGTPTNRPPGPVTGGGWEVPEDDTVNPDPDLPLWSPGGGGGGGGGGGACTGTRWITCSWY